MLITSNKNNSIINSDSTISNETFMDYKLNGRKISQGLENTQEDFSEIDSMLSKSGAEEWIKSIDDKSLLNKITARCIDLNKYHLLTPALCRHNFYGDTQKPAFQFLLDKILPQETKERLYFCGGPASGSAHILATALQKTLSKLQKNTDELLEHNEYVPLLERCIKSLSLCVHFSNNEENCESLLVDCILDDKRDFPLLIPVNMPGHALEMLIERTGPEVCTVTLYNSGMGLRDHHPLWPTSKMIYQLFLSHKNVPMRDLISQGTLQPFLTSMYDQVEFYEKFLSLVKNGQPVPPSKNRVDYQLAQKQSNCATKSIMAFFRHYLLKEINGSFLEKRGLYHLIKSEIYTLIGYEHLETLHSSIKGDVKYKLAKIEAVKKLYEVAQDEISYKTIMHSLTEFLEQIGEAEFVKKAKGHIKENNTVIEKFALMEIYQQHIAHYFLENYNEIDKYLLFLDQSQDSDNKFKLSQCIIEEKNRQYERMNYAWHQLSKNPDSLKKDMYKYAAFSAMDKAIAQDWLNEQLDKPGLSDLIKLPLKNIQENLNFDISKGNRGDPFKIID